MSAEPAPIRVLLADDHPIVLDGLERLFRLEPDFEVVGSCRDGEEVLRAVAAAPPDLLVLDLKMPRLDGLAVLRALQAAAAPTRVLLLTAALDEQQVVEALRLGVRGLVLKEMAPQLVIEAARRIHAGGQWFDAGLLQRSLDAIGRKLGGDGEATGLTPREREIVGMVVRGLRNRAIADELGISEGTVKLHLHHVYEKLGLANRMELLLHVQKHPL